MSDRQNLAQHAAGLCIAGMAAIGLGSAPALVPLAVFAAWGIDRLRSRDKTRAQTVLKGIIHAMEASGPNHKSVELALLFLKENRHKINITPQILADAAKHGNFPDMLYDMAFADAGVPEDDGIETCLRSTLTAAWQVLRKDDDIHKIFMQESVGALAIDMKNGFARIEKDMAQGVARIETGIEGVAKDVKDIKDKEHARDEILQELLNCVGDITRAVTPSEHLSLDALQTLARAFGETTLTQKDALIAFLTQKAADHRHLLAEIDALRGASTRIDNIRGAARAALEALDYDEAMRLLESARTIIREQLQEPIELNARLSERQAEIALIRGDTQTASSLLCAAADSFAALDPVVSARKRCGYASILYDHGYRYGGSGLADAIKLWRAARETLTEADHPLDWAQTAQNLAIALRNRGDRTQGPASTTLLAEAVTCYRDALRVRTEADHPLEWATTTQNLANALAIQGERTQGPAGTALLADAVTCYRDALRVRTEAGHPLEWALATQNLANALLAQGERIQGPAGTTLLTDAVTCYRDVLRVLTEADHPLEWAITTENLARAEKALADREGTDDPAPHLRAALGHAAEDYSQEEFSFEKLKEIASERQGAGLGSEEEKAARGAVLTQIAALKDDLPKPASHGGIGHNRPPKEFELQGKELEEVAESIETIETELLSKEPNVEVVAQKTSLLTKAAGWVAGKIDTTVDAFCKSFGATLGTGTAAAVFALPYWGTLAVLLGKLKEWLILALAL